MKKFLLLTGLASLLFTVACGSGNGGGGNFPPPQGNFSNSSLSGRFAYQLAGTSFSSGAAFREAGVFTADGNGTITGGTDDFAIGSSVFSDSLTGTYAVDKDGTGTAVITFGSGDQIRLAFTLVNTNKLYLIERDSFATGAGTAEKQDSTAFAAPPSGNFAFRLHTVSNVQGSTAAVGAFAVDSGGVISGNEDTNRGGVPGTSTVSGLLNFPNTSTGRGTGNLVDGAGTTTVNYYIIDANHVIFFSTVTGTPGLGRAERQSGGPFSNNSLSGNYAFGSQGDTAFDLGGVNTVGRFAANGSGGITAGAFDSVNDGTRSTNIDFTGTYSVASSGRATVTLTPSVGASVQQVFWMVSPTRAFFLTNDSSKVEDGALDLQQLSTFSNATLNGQYAFFMDGFDSAFKDRVGTLIWNGSGGLDLTEFVNTSGVTSVVALSGTYSVGSNGRTTASVNSLSNNLVFYLVSGNDGYLLQNDTGVAIWGQMSKQPQ